VRGNYRIAAGVLAVVLLAGSGGGAMAGKAAKGATCGEYGTNVRFEKTPSAAARKALKEEKLVMVLHVSGDFENPEFT
jgi:predicted NUDIX family NTP pyrophosphohydrolase